MSEANEVAPPPEAPAPPPEAPVAAEPKSAAVQTREAIEAIRELFDVLVPPEVVYVTDAFGTQHRLRANLPARAQILLMREIDALAGAEIDGLREAARTGGMAGAITMLVRAASRDEVLSGLVRAFDAAHPGLSRIAVERETALHPDVVIDWKDTADVFGVEEMVAGIVPFCLAFLRRLVGMTAEMLTQPEPPQAH